MIGESKFDGPGQRKFIQNMALGGAVGASTGNALATIATKGKAKYRPLRHAAIGGAAGGGAGVGMVSHQRRQKVKKNTTASAFGVDHGYEEIAKDKRSDRNRALTVAGGAAGAGTGLGAVSGVRGTNRALKAHPGEIAPKVGRLARLGGGVGGGLRGGQRGALYGAAGGGAAYAASRYSSKKKGS